MPGEGESNRPRVLMRNLLEYSDDELLQFAHEKGGTDYFDASVEVCVYQVVKWSRNYPLLIDPVETADTVFHHSDEYSPEELEAKENELLDDQSAGIGGNTLEYLLGGREAALFILEKAIAIGGRDLEFYTRGLGNLTQVEKDMLNAYLYQLRNGYLLKRRLQQNREVRERVQRLLDQEQSTPQA